MVFPDSTFEIDSLLTSTSKDKKIISVYPNPTRTQMGLQSNFPSKVLTVSIYTILGELKVILHRGVPCGGSFDLTDLTRGTYIIVAEFSDGQKSSTRMLYTP
jgi:hypothetical protein